MPNWCSTNWIIKGEKAVISDFADKCNSLKGKEDVMPNDFGKNWLGNLYVTLGYDIKKINSVNARGYIDSNDNSVACLFLGEPDKEPFTVTESQDGSAVLRFSTLSAWDMPHWLKEHFQRMEEEIDDFVFDYKSTDEFGNFHTCRTGYLIGDIFQIHNPKTDEWFECGLESKKEFVEKVAEMTGENLDVESIVKKDDFRPLFNAVSRYNEKLDDEDDEIELVIFEED